MELQILPWINYDGIIDEGPGRPDPDQQLPALFLTAFITCNCRSGRSSILNYDGNAPLKIKTILLTLYDNIHSYNTFNAFCCYPLLKEIQENTAPTMACKRLVKNDKNKNN